MRSLERACDVAKAVELRYVYMGNVPRHRYENTYCLGCGELFVKRFSFDVVRWRLTGDMWCPGCGERIAVEGEFHPGGYSYPYTIV